MTAATHATAAPSVEEFSVTRRPLTFDPGVYPDVKDPCLVHDGDTWHLYGTGCNAHGKGGPLEILHAVSPRLGGPWQQLDPVRLDRDLGGEAAAPGVVAADGELHLFVQTAWSKLGGTIEHFASDDGRAFRWVDTALTSRRRGPERGIYDPHPCEIDGESYLAYSGMNVVGRPDVFLARSRTGLWSGPWERLGCIVGHADVDCHNQFDDPDYEWGLEGGQIVELADGRVLFNAVCFLRDHPAGTKQRMFFAVADEVLGPYDVIGAAIEPIGGPTAGENGHGCVVIDRGRVHVVFQERRAPDWHWRYARAGLSVVARSQSLELAG
ncbi:MAG: hypothetical protein ABR520_11545 [Mycobacteriales bacterium]|nr:hypothetical protein [Frankia sp.]